MPSITLTLGQDGRPQGLTREDQSHYRRWRARVEALKPGETIAFSWATPRTPEIHRRHFLMLKWIFENQEVFDSQEDLRSWTEIGARHVHVFYVEGLRFEMPKSIAYECLDADEFKELHKRVKDFLLSHEALKELWPHSPVGVSYAAMLHLIEEGL